MIYLRWLDPRTDDKLKEHVLGLCGDTTHKRQAVEDLLQAISGPTTYFMALGLIRHLEFDEGLLAYFWDRMGGGSTQTYVQIRQELITSRLLTPASGSGGHVYRLHEDVHRQLYRALEHRIGGQERVATIHFFAGEYYLRLFERSRQQTLDDLASFVYHSLQHDDEAARAYRYVFETDLLPSLHRAGMALRLHDLLNLFWEKARKSPTIFSPLAKCRILIEMAHVCNDLSQFKECLDFTEQGKTILGTVPSNLEPGLQATLRKWIWYYSAVAYSNTGQSDLCPSSYFKIVSSPQVGERPDALACLALSYLAHDLKYRDIERSIEYAEHAVAIAREIADPHLIAKTLCSLAESYIYTRAFDKAEPCFAEARGKCLEEVKGFQDRREFGRVMKNWGLLSLVNGQSGDAEKKLREARKTSVSAGDRRRVATVDLYLALVLRCLGKREEAESLLASVVQTIYDLGDGRYLVPAAMTYALWKEPAYSGVLADLPASVGDERLASVLLEIAKEKKFELYAEFWRERFRTVVLA